MPKWTLFDKITSECCVKLGYCGGALRNGKPIRLIELLPDTGDISVEEFVMCLLISEGFEDKHVRYEYGLLEQKDQLKRIFLKFTGSGIISVDVLMK